MNYNLSDLKQKRPLLWLNSKFQPVTDVLPKLPLQMSDIADAEERLERFAPLLAEVFPETRYNKGIIESELVPVPKFSAWYSSHYGIEIGDQLFVKADHNLPVAGSVKARGGIYEVLCFAEQLAESHGLLKKSDDYRNLLKPEVKQLFDEYTVAVGSTGNLGMSIGISAAGLGFKAKVYMSHEAKEWKKNRLRERGVEIVEIPGDYSKAVKAGRDEAGADPKIYFIDDENSPLLFLGYSVAALRLRRQLSAARIKIDSEYPLVVHIPCGVGGAPGGICFGLKQVFGDNVHCFFAEPVNSSAFLVGMLNEFAEPVSIYEAGLDNLTDADGLAVGTASQFAGKMVKSLVSGMITVPDAEMYDNLKGLYKSEKIKIEPSAAAGFAGPVRLLSSPHGQEYSKKYDLSNATQILWTTGGRFVPDSIFKKWVTFH